MLQNIRKNIQGTMAKIIVGLIIATFALFGVESILTGGGIAYVAEVNDVGITGPELQQQVNLQKRRLLSSMGQNVDPAMLDDQLLAGPALEILIQKMLYLQAADDYQLSVSDASLGTMIGAIAAFHVEGRFDPQRYRQVLSDQGYSPGSFQNSVRDDVLMTQLRAGLVGSEFVTDSELAHMSVVSEEQRDLRYLVIPLDEFRRETELDEADIEAWFDAHREQYKTTESVILDYIELSSENYLGSVTEEDIRALFELEQEELQLAEERAVSHILFEQGEDESEQELQARIAEVVALLPQQSFADLAKQYSQDLGSANFGGELGFTSGESFPSEIEEAVATLSLDEVSAPVASDAGWHLLKVTEIRAGKSIGYESVRAELEQRLQQEQAQRQLVTAVEELRDMVFNAEDLSEPAAALELVVQTGVEITRNQSEGMFADPRLLAAAFSKDVVEEAYNSEVIELEGSRYVVLRASLHKPPRVKPLAEVRAQVVNTMTEELAKDRVVEQAQVLLLSLRSGASVEEVALANGYQWQVELGAKRDNRNVPPRLLARAFTLPEPDDGTTLFDYVQSADGDIEMFELVRVMAGRADRLAPARRQQLSARMRQEGARAVDTAYQQALRARADVVKG